MKYTPSERQYLKDHDAAELDEYEEPESWFFWQAYHALRGDRKENGTMPFLPVMGYGEWAGVTCPVQKQRLLRMVFALNDAELDYGRAKAQI